LHKHLLFALLAAALGSAACGGGGGGGPPPVLVTALQANPKAFAPGGLGVLTPLLAGGQGRIDTDIGPVQSGVGDPVGPKTSGNTYTLTVDRQGGVDTVVVDVPLRYRERVRELPPSAIERTRHGAATLTDGRVLLVGGASLTPLFWANAEIFEPATGTFAPVGDLSAGRAESAVVALAGGGALALGGPTNVPTFDAATRIEEWDPAALAWSIRTNTLSNRSQMTATLLDGGAVLVVGGIATGGLATERDAELYEPGLGSRSPAGEMARWRAGHTATRLANGTVLVAGGSDTVTGDFVVGCEVYDPATEAFALDANLVHGRLQHAAVALADGRVLLLGGDDATGPVATAEVYDPALGECAPAGDMVVPRTFARAVRLLDGTVLAAGGVDATGQPTDRLEVWDPNTNAWRQWATRLPSRRTGHSLHVLPDGRVFLFGGDAGNGFPQPTCYVLD
jgi:hypothetical protein